jgi:hypothetical protein
VELFELLERVALDASPDGLSYDGVQVDKPPRTKEAVQLFGAGRIPPHQALAGGHLVVGEVVYVHARVSLPGRHDLFDDALERLPLRLVVRCPQWRVLIRQHAKQELAASLARELRSLEVEKHIAR